MKLTPQMLQGGAFLQIHDPSDPAEVNLFNFLKAMHADATAFKMPIFGSQTWNPGSLGDGAGETATFTVPGAAVGDFVLPSLGEDIQGMSISAQVVAADTVDVRLQNESGGTLDLASITARVAVLPMIRWQAFGLCGIATWDPGSLIDAAGESKTVTVTGAKLGDFAVAALGVAVQGMTVSASVTADDTVIVRLQNESGGTLDLASATVRVLVVPAATGFPLLGSATYDAPSLIDAAGASKDVIVLGAKLGDYAAASLDVSTQSILVTAAVKGDDLVTVRFQNETAGTLNLASATLRVGVLPMATAMGLSATFEG